MTVSAKSLFVYTLLGALSLSGIGRACNEHGRRSWTQEELDELERKWGFDWAFTGISTFAHLKHVRCLTQPSETYDIAILGVPFDTATSYRPGARFGPRAIRAASSRQTSFRGWNPRAGINPYADWAKVLDCGDIPVTPMDNAVALAQMTRAFGELLDTSRSAAAMESSSAAGTPPVPKLVALGGDHSIALAALRGLRAAHGRPVRVLHFDAHLDTWHPAKYPSAWPSEQAHFNHGSMFWLAGGEGLIVNATNWTPSPEQEAVATGSTASVHAGLRTRLSGLSDYDDDDAQNWVRIAADDMDEPPPEGGSGAATGTAAIISRILATLGTTDPVYLSVDIDVLDPAFAPGTGTPEPGGWTTRELIRILRGIWQLNVVGADVVEVAPAYEAGFGEATALAGAQVAYEIVTSLVLRGRWEREERERLAELGEDGQVVLDGEGRVKDEL